MKSFYGTPFKKIRRDLQPAIAELNRSADIMRNNIPIARKEGRVNDMRHEQKNLKSFQRAIGHLVKI